MAIQIEGLTQNEAYLKIVALSQSRKGNLVHVDTLEDGRRIQLRMTGRKSRYDFTVHVDSERSWVTYHDDFFMDIIRKREIQPSIVTPLIEALEESVKLVPINDIYRKYPELSPSKTSHFSGHTIDYLLRMIRWLGLQEDVNYWGPRYAGRMKPIIAMRQHFIEGKGFEEVMKAHKISR